VSKGKKKKKKKGRGRAAPNADSLSDLPAQVPWKKRKKKERGEKR